jgi:hypothetical protein
MNKEYQLAKFIESLSDSDRLAIIGKLRRAIEAGKWGISRGCGRSQYPGPQKTCGAKPFETFIHRGP